MGKNSPYDNRLINEIYKNIDEVRNLINTMNDDRMNFKKDNSLEQIEAKLRQTQKSIVKSVVSEVLSKVMKEQGICNRPCGTSDDGKQATMIEVKFGLKEAEDLIHRIEQKASSINLSIVCAVYDASANPIAIHCMDQSYVASYDIAVNKAYTSAALKMSTSDLKQLSQPGKELYGIQYTNQGRIVIFGGGEPLYYNNKLVGAIGVSGASEHEDTELAKYGKDILEEVMKW